jgi:hypothetical protein
MDFKPYAYERNPFGESTTLSGVKVSKTYEFTKDEVYNKNKTKVNAYSGNFDYKINFRFPIVYDQNWVGYGLDRQSADSRLLSKTITLFLEKYKG